MEGCLLREPMGEINTYLEVFCLGEEVVKYGAFLKKDAMI